MNVESLREFCLSLPQVTECFPFDEWVLVFKIEGKMFLFCDLSAEEKRISLKCDPELAIELRERYPEIEPGYHTNKRLWNSIWLRPSIDDKVICDCIVHAYSEVLKNYPKSNANLYRNYSKHGNKRNKIPKNSLKGDRLDQYISPRIGQRQTSTGRNHRLLRHTTVWARPTWKFMGI